MVAIMVVEMLTLAGQLSVLPCKAVRRLASICRLTRKKN